MDLKLGALETKPGFLERSCSLERSFSRKMPPALGASLDIEKKSTIEIRLQFDPPFADQLEGGGSVSGFKAKACQGAS